MTSLALVAGSLARYAMTHGTGFSVRGHAGLIFPLVLIWLAEELAEKAIDASGGWLTPSNADRIVRLVGWLWLIVMLLHRNRDLLP
ncbi:hypothetical protein [Luteolibacter marinus]|uniref:hypothetical protein n=1 Tax=Luteolibacter marinus TaxID=2776705 RepID=UPI001869482A|nr:hypothetical protein [Luteolibacter marinus]